MNTDDLFRNAVVNSTGNQFKVYKTVDECRTGNISGVKTGDYALLVGGSFPGDTEGGWFVWNWNSYAEDDGQNAILPNMIEDGGRGRWKAINGFAALSNPDMLCRIPFFFDYAPQPEERLLMYSVSTAFRIFESFAGTVFHVEAPPIVTNHTLVLKKNGNPQANITFQTDSSVTFEVVTADLDENRIYYLQGDQLIIESEDNETALGFTSMTILAQYWVDQGEIPDGFPDNF